MSRKTKKANKVHLLYLGYAGSGGEVEYESAPNGAFSSAGGARRRAYELQCKLGQGLVDLRIEEMDLQE